jgi:hypothetical protein
MNNSDDIDWTEVYEALADDRRRLVLDYVTDAAGQVRIEDLVEHLPESDGSGDPEEGQTREEIQLHHVHLPALAEARLVEWDRSGGTVRPTSLGLQLPVGILRPQAATTTAATPPQNVSD